MEYGRMRLRGKSDALGRVAQEGTASSKERQQLEVPGWSVIMDIVGFSSILDVLQ